VSLSQLKVSICTWNQPVLSQKANREFLAINEPHTDRDKKEII